MWSGNDDDELRGRARLARGPQDDRRFDDDARRRGNGPSGWDEDERAEWMRRQERDRSIDMWNGRGRGGDIYPGPYDDRESNPRRSGRGERSWMGEGARAWEGRREGSWAEDEGASGRGWVAAQDPNRSGGGQWEDRFDARRYGRGRGRGSSDQADGFRGLESEDMRWSRQQGLYGGSEYGGYIGNPDRPDRSHAGKGPKGWQRSDERIRDEVSEALARHPGIDASEIEVEVDGGEVTLRGQVDERRAKRLAEECAEDIFGVEDVQNQLRIRREEGATARGGRKAAKGSEREVPRSTGQEARPGATESTATRPQGGART